MAPLPTSDERRSNVRPGLLDAAAVTRTTCSTAPCSKGATHKPALGAPSIRRCKSVALAGTPLLCTLSVITLPIRLSLLHPLELRSHCVSEAVSLISVWESTTSSGDSCVVPPD